MPRMTFDTRFLPGSFKRRIIIQDCFWRYNENDESWQSSGWQVPLGGGGDDATRAESLSDSYQSRQTGQDRVGETEQMLAFCGSKRSEARRGDYSYQVQQLADTEAGRVDGRVRPRGMDGKVSRVAVLLVMLEQGLSVASVDPGP